MNPRMVNVGAGVVVATNIDFINGYQEGHLSYMAAKSSHTAPYTDEEIMEMFMKRLEDVSLTSLHSIGFTMGWLHTLATKGTKNTEPLVPTSIAASSDVALGLERE